VSDTLEYVSWHLELACPFRRGEAVTDLRAARQATWELRAIEGAEARQDLYGVVCVTGTSYSREGTKPIGFRIGEAVEKVGGLAAAREVCGRCPANALKDRMAGCCGTLEIEPTRGVEDQLRSTLVTSGLRTTFGEVFLETRPLWYGLWVTSPLTVRQMEMMRMVLSPRMGKGVKGFWQACALALEHGLRLHVRMPPPGHVDFGFHTVFPHCPRCKMGNGAQWETPYSSEETTCAACGERYVPAETATMERMEPEEWTDLEQVLTAEAYAMFMEEWGRRHSTEVEEGVGGLMKRFGLEAEKEVRSREEWSWVRRVLGWIWKGKG
jgi:hypothetical protein